MHTDQHNYQARNSPFQNHPFKGEQGELQFYFRKIPLHQQNFLVISVLSNSPWLSRNLKNVQTVSTKLFLIGNTCINISTNQG